MFIAVSCGHDISCFSDYITVYVFTQIFLPNYFNKSFVPI